MKLVIEDIIIILLIIAIIYLFLTRKQYTEKFAVSAGNIAGAKTWYCALAPKSATKPTNDWMKYPTSCLYTKNDWICGPIVKKKDGNYYTNNNTCTSEQLVKAVPSSTCGPGSDVPANCYIIADADTVSSSSSKSTVSTTAPPKATTKATIPATMKATIPATMKATIPATMKATVIVKR